ncbi:hypothetical protein K449DRAFT_390237, partial [Hypoxylon sp. EC38]
MAIYENCLRYHRNYHLSHHIPIMFALYPGNFYSGSSSVWLLPSLLYQFLPSSSSFMGNSAH